MFSLEGITINIINVKFVLIYEIYLQINPHTQTHTHTHIYIIYIYIYKRDL